MPDAIMYREDCFVVLETDREEQFLSREELIAKLKPIFLQNNQSLPRELIKIQGIDRQIEYSIDNYYEFDIGEGKYLQWYVARLEK
jgi:hypothetical protein